MLLSGTERTLVLFIHGHGSQKLKLSTRWEKKKGTDGISFQREPLLWKAERRLCPKTENRKPCGAEKQVFCKDIKAEPRTRSPVCYSRRVFCFCLIYMVVVLGYEGVQKRTPRRQSALIGCLFFCFSLQREEGVRLERSTVRQTENILWSQWTPSIRFCIKCWWCSWNWNKVQLHNSCC